MILTAVITPEVAVMITTAPVPPPPVKINDCPMVFPVPPEPMVTGVVELRIQVFRVQVPDNPLPLPLVAVIGGAAI